MPIRRDLLPFYGETWKTEIVPRILDRAGNKCEFCGRPNRTRVQTITGKVEGTTVMYWALGDQTSWLTHEGKPSPIENNALLTLCSLHLWDKARRFKYRLVRTVLGIAHLDHNPENHADDNLRALCGWCHLNYDKHHHRESRIERKDAARPLLQQL